MKHAFLTVFYVARCALHKVAVFASWLTVVMTAAFLLLCLYWYYDSHFDGPATKMEGSRIRGVPVFHARDNITVEFQTTRLKSCSIDVSRLVRRAGRATLVGDQDHLIDRVYQSFRGGGIKLESFYTANLQGNLAPGKYVIFSYGRYYCNPIDYIFLHDIKTDEVPFEIVPDDVPISGREASK